MRTILQDFCSSIGIEYAGIAGIGPYNELEAILKERIAKGHFTGMEEGDIKKRIDPSLTMGNVKSIIVCLFPYFIGNKEEANISKYAYSLDYHTIASEKLKSIGEFLTSKMEGFEYRAFVDSGPLVDRYLAYLAGLGYFGINSSIITDKYGSYQFIGYILNNYPFESDEPIDKTCIKCGECIKRCPGSAILGDFSINPKRCISYITQKKGELTEEEIEILNKNPMLFGCDICQDVCPHNKGIEITNMDEFKKDLMYKLEYDEISDISNREFKRRYGKRAFSWRGRGVILRNFKCIK